MKSGVIFSLPKKPHFPIGLSQYLNKSGLCFITTQFEIFNLAEKIHIVTNSIPPFPSIYIHIYMSCRSLCKKSYLSNVLSRRN